MTTPLHPYTPTPLHPYTFKPDTLKPCALDANAWTEAVTVTDAVTGRARRFSFDHCQGPWTGLEGEGGEAGGARMRFDRDGASQSQEDLYRDVGAPALDAAWSGFNVCVLAYGQTGAGKSYAMVGRGGSTGGGGGDGGGGGGVRYSGGGGGRGNGHGGGGKGDGSTGSSTGNDGEGGVGGDERGLIPRIGAALFARIARARASGVAGEVRVEVSMVEIYCERVRDLLTPGAAGAGLPDLHVRDHPRDGPIVQGARTCAVTSHAQVGPNPEPYTLKPRPLTL